MLRCENMELITLIRKYVMTQERINNGETVPLSVIWDYRGIEVKLHWFQPSHWIEGNSQLYAATALALKKEPPAPFEWAINVLVTVEKIFVQAGDRAMSRQLFSPSPTPTPERSQESTAVVLERFEDRTECTLYVCTFQTVPHREQFFFQLESELRCRGTAAVCQRSIRNTLCAGWTVYNFYC
jgi:hypothetical protein